MEDQEKLIRQIERLALHTWPAQIQLPLDDWLLRASDGITKRANSVWTSTGSMPAAGDWLHTVTNFYHKQELPVRFHISEATNPELISYLNERGFKQEVPCSVMIAPVEQVLLTHNPIQSLCTFEIQAEADFTWLSHFMEMEEHGDDECKRSFYERIFNDISLPKCFITLFSGNTAVAVGTSIVEDSWAGLLNLVVHPTHRGRGIGKELLHQLAIWSSEHGARWMYLQVVNDNKPAFKLYKKTGFSSLYSYHYMVEEPPPSPSP